MNHSLMITVLSFYLLFRGDEISLLYIINIESRAPLNISFSQTKSKHDDSRT